MPARFEPARIHMITEILNLMILPFQIDNIVMLYPFAILCVGGAFIYLRRMM